MKTRYYILFEIARGNVERNVDVEDGASTDTVYDEVNTLAQDALKDAGFDPATDDMAARVCKDIAQSFACP